MTLRLPIHLEQESADFRSLALREYFLRHLWGRFFCFAQLDYSRYHSVLLKRGCEIPTYAIGVILQRRILVLVCACGLPSCQPASRKISVAHSSWRGVRSRLPRSRPLITLSVRSGGGASSITWPLALRRASFFRAFSYSSLDRPPSERRRAWPCAHPEARTRQLNLVGARGAVVGTRLPGRTKDRLKFKHSNAPAVRREAEQDWGSERWR